MGYDDMGYDDGLGEDYVGEDYVGDDEVMGAVARGRRLAKARGPQLKGASRAPIKLRGYIGLGFVTFTSVSGTVLVMTVEPQRSFRPERLVIDRADGSSVTTPLSARVNNIFIGDQPQSPSVEQPAPISMFRADATFSGIDFNKCIPGQKIRVELSISAAPAGTEVVRLEAGFYGDMMR
jgi:hypothetical protein